MSETRKGRLRAFFQSEFFYNFRRSPAAVAGALIVVLVLLVALIGPYFTVQDPYNMAELQLADAYKPPFWMEGGDPKFLLGTDQQGRDMVSAIVYGSQVSLVIGLLGTLMASAIGIVLGLVSGYFGGKVDALIMRIADVQLSFPSMLIALFLMSILGRSVANILLSLMLVGWVRYARTVRGETLSVKLSFLGLGVPISRPSLGMLCNNGFTVLYSGLWWVSILPGLYIMIIVFGINLLGDFLRDEMNPKLK